jgi:hypothetical protein
MSASDDAAVLEPRTPFVVRSFGFSDRGETGDSKPVRSKVPCVRCRTLYARPTRRVPVDVVDHFKPAPVFPELFWEPTNHRRLCYTHNAKQAAECARLPDCTGDGLARSVGAAPWGSRDGERRRASTIEYREPGFHTAYGGRNHASGES